MPAYTPAELQTVSDAEGWHAVCGTHVAVVTGRKSVFVYRKRHGKFDTDFAIVFTRLEAADLYELLRRPALDDPDGSGLWNQTPDGARVMSEPCCYCGIPADLTETEHGFNVILGTHEACANNDYCGACFSSSVWYLDEAVCSNCGNADRLMRCDEAAAGHGRAEQRAGFTG